MGRIINTAIKGDGQRVGELTGILSIVIMNVDNPPMLMFHCFMEIKNQFRIANQSVNKSTRVFRSASRRDGDATRRY